MNRWLGVLIPLAFVAACSSLQFPLLAPTLALEHVRPVQDGGLVPTIKLGMRVSNPNTRALKLRGLSYRVALEGFDIVSGSASSIPVIPAQGDALVELDAKLGILESARLLTMLLARPQGELGFSLQADLDTGLPLIGVLPVTQSGVIDLQTYTARIH